MASKEVSKLLPKVPPSECGTSELGSMPHSSMLGRMAPGSSFDGPPPHPGMFGIPPPGGKPRKKYLPVKNYQQKGGFTSANTRHLAMIASHPNFYLIDPNTPPFPVDRHTFDQFLCLLQDALYPYNQHQHGGLKICTFCFGFVTRKVGFHSDPPTPDQVLPEYTLAEAVGKLDDTNDKRYRTLVDLLNFMKKTGYRPLCRPDPHRHSSRGMGYSHEAPDGYAAVYDFPWEPHFPKFHCNFSHKCYQFYLGNGPGAPLARRIRRIAAPDKQDDWLKNMEVLPSQLAMNFGELFQLDPTSLHNLNNKDPYFPVHLQKAVDPEFSECFPGQFQANTVESELLKKTFELLGMSKLTLVLPHSPVPVRLDLSQCRFFSEAITLSSEKIREWAFLICTGRRWQQAREEEPQPVVSMALPHEEQHFMEYQDEMLGPIIKEFRADEDRNFGGAYPHMMFDRSENLSMIENAKTEILDEEPGERLESEARQEKKKKQQRKKKKMELLQRETESTALETTEEPSPSAEALGKRSLGNPEVQSNPN